MGMEPFDYLTYKRKKMEEGGSAELPKKRVYSAKEKALALGCIITFFCCFIFATMYVGSKSSKIDIEYGRLGKNQNKMTEFKDEIDGEEVTRKEKITVDKRLFIIQQEERGPSESKIIEKNKDSEVISNNEFNEIKTKNEEYLNNQNQKEEDKTEAKQPEQIKPVVVNKVAIKPKLPVATVLPEGNTKVSVKSVGGLDANTPVSKVLVGKYSTMEEAKKAQEKMPDVPSFVKKINGYYTLQVGSYESYEVAKATAGRLKLKGFDSWIYQ